MQCPPGFGNWTYILSYIYTLPLGNIICGHNFNYRLYADDSQLYLTCTPTATPSNILTSKARLEACITDIWQWMPLKRLKLNDNKTEFLFIHSKYHPNSAQHSIAIGNDSITSSLTAQNLGVTFDCNLSLKPHLSSLCKAAFFQTCRISRIHKFLTAPATKIMVHSLIASHLDYCNSALTGLPDCVNAKL